MDPVECAHMMCDQHCFKIGSEIIESVWDGVLVLAPDLGQEADILGIPGGYRNKRHSKQGHMWHPFSVWNTACKANMKRSLINADAIFKEHLSRTGTSHCAWEDCKYLLYNIDRINFMGKRWVRWYATQNGVSEATTPPAAKAKDLKARREWCLVHTLVEGVDRNSCKMTEPPQCINESQLEFSGCKVPGDVVAAYTKYYIAKTKTIKGGMRYYYTTPPEWLTDAADNIRTTRK